LLLNLDEIILNCLPHLPTVNFINFFAQFFCEYFVAKKLQSQMFQLWSFWRQNIGKKCWWNWHQDTHTVWHFDFVGVYKKVSTLFGALVLVISCYFNNAPFLKTILTIEVVWLYLNETFEVQSNNIFNLHQPINFPSYCSFNIKFTLSVV